MRTFFDTNVLVYLFDNDAPAKRERARELLREETSEGRIVLSTQVLQEFYVAVTRKLAVPVPAETAEEALHDLLTLPVMPIDPPLVVQAARTSRVHTLSFWDALIVESAQGAGATRLLTEDLQPGRRFGDLEIENPFAGL